MSRAEKSGLTSHLIRIDPLSRDIVTYPKTSHYRVEFGKTFTNIVGLELVDARIPFTEPTITSDRNTFMYQVGSGTVRTVTIDPGTYTASSLVTEMNTQFTAHGDGMSVAYSATTQKLTFSAGGDFSIFPSRSTMRRVLGITSDAYRVESSSSSYTPSGMVDVTGSTKYLVIKCTDLDEPLLNASCDPGVGILHVSDPPEFRAYPVHLFPATKQKLSGLTIRIERDSGVEYDTGGLNHVLLFQLLTRD